MSLAQLQTALTELIRLPDHHRDGLKSIADFMANFELNRAEQNQLQALAGNPGVRKYGRSMREVRWEKIKASMPVSQKFIPAEGLEDLRCDVFEPRSIQTAFQKLPMAFLDFLLSSPEAFRYLSERAPAFIFDLLKFERAQTLFRSEKAKTRLPAPPQSQLRHSSFVICELDYDAPSFVADFAEDIDGIADYAPARRHLWVLVTAPVEGNGIRYFEIDSETRIFLETENSIPTKNTVRPDSYSDLVALGLVRSDPI